MALTKRERQALREYDARTWNGRKSTGADLTSTEDHRGGPGARNTNANRKHGAKYGTNYRERMSVKAANVVPAKRGGAVPDTTKRRKHDAGEAIRVANVLAQRKYESQETEAPRPATVKHTATCWTHRGEYMS